MFEIRFARTADQFDGIIKTEPFGGAHRDTIATILHSPPLTIVWSRWSLQRAGGSKRCFSLKQCTSPLEVQPVELHGVVPINRARLAGRSPARCRSDR